MEGTRHVSGGGISLGCVSLIYLIVYYVCNLAANQNQILNVLKVIAFIVLGLNVGILVIALIVMIIAAAIN